MQFGIRAANYPFIADDMDNLQLPAALKPFQHKLFGLTINPERLAAIREERRENSRLRLTAPMQDGSGGSGSLIPQKSDSLPKLDQLLSRRDFNKNPGYLRDESSDVLTKYFHE